MTQVINDEDMIFLHILINIVARTIISVIGVVSNFINMVIFSKLGLRDSMSVGLFSLSLTDFLVTGIQLANCVAFVIDLQSSDTESGVKTLDYVLGWLISALYGVSCWITAVISLERCYCVVFPFKVKQAFTRSRCVLVILMINVIHICIHVPLAAIDRLTSIEVLLPSADNMTTGTSEMMFSIIVNPEMLLAEFVIDLVAGVFMWLVSQSVVIVCAVWMGYSLEASSKVRQKTSSHEKSHQQLTVHSKDPSTLSGRERRLVKVVFVLAIALTGCNIAKMLTTVVYYTFPGTNSDKQGNLNSLLWALAYMFGSLGCSISFIVYVTLNVNFRREFSCVFVWMCSRSSE